MNHFLAKEWSKLQAQKRGGGKVMVHFFEKGIAQFTEAEQTPVIGRYELLDRDHMKLEYPGEDTNIVEFVISSETLTLKLPKDEPMTLKRAKEP
jgi:uncharacterized protein (DUF2344 family)